MRSRRFSFTHYPDSLRYPVIVEAILHPGCPGTSDECGREFDDGSPAEIEILSVLTKAGKRAICFIMSQVVEEAWEQVL